MPSVDVTLVNKTAFALNVALAAPGPVPLEFANALEPGATWTADLVLPARALLPLASMHVRCDHGSNRFSWDDALARLLRLAGAGAGALAAAALVLIAGLRVARGSCGPWRLGAELSMLCGMVCFLARFARSSESTPSRRLTHADSIFFSLPLVTNKTRGAHHVRQQNPHHLCANADTPCTAMEGRAIRPVGSR